MAEASAVFGTGGHACHSATDFFAAIIANGPPAASHRGRVEFEPAVLIVQGLKAAKIRRGANAQDDVARQRGAYLYEGLRHW